MADDGDLSYLLEKTFKAKTFPRDKKLVLTIKEGRAQEVGEKKEVKPVIYFLEDPRGFILNNTGYEELAKAHGTKSVKAYVGARVELSWTDKVKSPQGVPGGLELRVVQKAAK